MGSRRRSWGRGGHRGGRGGKPDGESFGGRQHNRNRNRSSAHHNQNDRPPRGGRGGLTDVEYELEREEWKWRRQAAREALRRQAERSATGSLERDRRRQRKLLKLARRMAKERLRREFPERYGGTLGDGTPSEGTEGPLQMMKRRRRRIRASFSMPVDSRGEPPQLRVRNVLHWRDVRDYYSNRGQLLDENRAPEFGEIVFADGPPGWSVLYVPNHAVYRDAAATLASTVEQRLQEAYADSTIRVRNVRIGNEGE